MVNGIEESIKNIGEVQTDEKTNFSCKNIAK